MHNIIQGENKDVSCFAYMYNQGKVKKELKNTIVKTDHDWLIK